MCHNNTVAFRMLKTNLPSRVNEVPCPSFDRSSRASQTPRSYTPRKRKVTLANSFAEDRVKACYSPASLRTPDSRRQPRSRPALLSSLGFPESAKFFSAETSVDLQENPGRARRVHASSTLPFRSVSHAMFRDLDETSCGSFTRKDAT